MTWPRKRPRCTRTDGCTFPAEHFGVCWAPPVDIPQPQGPPAMVGIEDEQESDGE